MNEITEKYVVPSAELTKFMLFGNSENDLLQVMGPPASRGSTICRPNMFDHLVRDF
jgi:hypothetical protein